MHFHATRRGSTAFMYALPRGDASHHPAEPPSTPFCPLPRNCRIKPLASSSRRRGCARGAQVAIVFAARDRCKFIFLRIVSEVGRRGGGAGQGSRALFVRCRSAFGRKRSVQPNPSPIWLRRCCREPFGWSIQRPRWAGDAGHPAPAANVQEHAVGQGASDLALRFQRSLLGVEMVQARRAHRTQFDAPRHWISGKDYADGSTDTIPVKNFVAPVNVIDRSKRPRPTPTIFSPSTASSPGRRNTARSSPGPGCSCAPTGTSATAAPKRFSTPTRPGRIRRVPPPRRSSI